MTGKLFKKAAVLAVFAAAAGCAAAFPAWTRIPQNRAMPPSLFMKS